MCFKVIASQRWDVFRDMVYSDRAYVIAAYWLFVNAGIFERRSLGVVNGRDRVRLWHQRCRLPFNRVKRHRWPSCRVNDSPTLLWYAVRAAERRSASDRETVGSPRHRSSGQRPPVGSAHGSKVSTWFHLTAPGLRALRAVPPAPKGLALTWCKHC